MNNLRQLISMWLVLTGVLTLIYLGSARQTKTEVDINLKLDTAPQVEINFKHSIGEQNK